MNKALRRQLRAVRKEDKATDARRAALGLPEHVKLLPEAQSDALLASAQRYGEQRFAQNWRHTRRGIASGSIFTPAAVAAARGAKPKAAAGGVLAAGKRPAGGPAAGAAAAGQLSKKRRLDPSVKLGFSDPGAKRSKA